MKAQTVRVISKVGWALGKTLNLVGFLGARVAREITNRPKHNIEIINSYTGEVMHQANNISSVELNKVLDAMRVLKGTVQVIVKTVK